MTYSCFESIGAYLPPTVQTTQDVVERMEYKPKFDLEEVTGIRTRRVCDSSPDSFEDSFTLALRAAQDCLENSRYSADQLDVVISSSISRYLDKERVYFEPSFAVTLKNALGAQKAIHFDVSNACAGMMTGVIILDRMIKAGTVRNGMVVSGERITPIAETAIKEIDQPYDPQFGSLTVGDSGSAVILHESTSPEDRINYVELSTSSAWSHLCIGKPSDKNPGIALYTDNHQMHKSDRLRLWPAFQRDMLEKRGTTFADEQFDYVVHHQVGTKFIERMARMGTNVFEAPSPASLSVVEKYGNTSSTSHFVVLHDHLKDNGVEKGTKFLLVPAASGVVTGCLSATISSLEV